MNTHHRPEVINRKSHVLKLEYVMPVTGSTEQPPCRACATIPSSQEYKRTVDHAVDVKPHTPWDCLNEVQCRAMMEKLQSQVRRVRQKVNSNATVLLLCPNLITNLCLPHIDSELRATLLNYVEAL